MKRVYCYFCQQALLNISLSVDTANGSQCNRFLLSGLTANMATILINFHQNSAFVRSFQHFAIKFQTKKIHGRLKSASKSSLSWQGKHGDFLRELNLAIDPSNLASKNDVTSSQSFRCMCKKNFLLLTSISFGSVSLKILVINANEEISAMLADLFLF